MAQVTLTHPFAEIHGSIGKDKIINRQKKRYAQFPAFLRTLIYQSLKSEE